MLAKNLLPPAPGDLDWVRFRALADLCRELNLEALSWDAARAVHDLVLESRPKACLEIGLGQGASTLAILQALDSHGEGHLISIDRNPEPAGMERVRHSGLRSRLDFRPRPSYLALPALVEEGARFQLAFIDGRHLFDYLLVDLFFTDLLLDPQGLVVLDDVDRPELERAARFFETNRGFTRLRGFPERLAVLRKESEDSRAHEHAPF